MLTEKKKKYFQQMLNKQLEELFRKSSENPFSNVAEVTNQAADFTDQASLESDLDLNIHIRERDGRLMAKIKEALMRLDDGSYGICEECGEEISEKRLKARPVTTVCITCKKKQEAEEKLRGV